MVDGYRVLMMVEAEIEEVGLGGRWLTLCWFRGARWGR